MKHALVLLVALSSLPALAGTFEDRENAIQANQKEQFAKKLTRENLARNQLFLAKLRRVIDEHKGLKTPLSCRTESAENSVANNPRKDLTYVLTGHGLEAQVQYVPDEAQGGFIISGIGLAGMGGYAKQPEPASCSIELRDGEACDVSLESDEDGSSDSVHVEATCINASLKKTRQNLGKISE